MEGTPGPLCRQVFHAGHCACHEFRRDEGLDGEGTCGGGDNREGKEFRCGGRGLEYDGFEGILVLIC